MIRYVFTATFREQQAAASSLRTEAVQQDDAA